MKLLSIGSTISIVVALFFPNSHQIVHSADFIDIDGLGSMFYWNVKSSKADAPTLLWLNGGPGCSSMYGSLMQIGPFRLNEALNTLSINPYSWHQDFNLIFVDQPLTVGFSFPSAPNYVLEASKETNNLHTFLKKMPTTVLSGDLYVAGESFAAFYISKLAEKLANEPIPNVDFSGIAIGNGWYGPQQTILFKQYVNGLRNVKPITDDFFQKHERLEQSAGESYSHFTQLMNIREQIFAKTGVASPYNVMSKEVLEPDVINNFLNTPGVLDELLGDSTKADAVRLNILKNRQDSSFDTCNQHTYTALSRNLQLSSFPSLGNALHTLHVPDKASFRTLIYNGVNDMVCHWTGIEGSLSGIPKFPMASRTLMKKEIDFKLKTYVGVYRQSEDASFTVMRVKNAGHMVPSDVPEVALEMVKRFLVKGGKMLKNTNESDDAFADEIDIVRI